MTATAARLAALAWLAGGFACAAAADSQQMIQTVKAVEQSVGFHATGNFTRAEPGITAYYRCYFTGRRELPDSYNELRLREGTKDGCRLDEARFDVFFYPIEAAASGDAPITQSLAAAPAERVATVVSHEDFHEQVQRLPDTISEAAATLVGFLTAGTAVEDLSAEAELFLRKAEMINRGYARLAEIYKTERQERRALVEKQQLFAALQAECAATQPRPRTFNPCVSAPNNAGLAFDHSYTKYYPLVYQVYESCRRDLKCTVTRIGGAPQKQSEAEVVAYFRSVSGY